jgi:two-component system, OmpR family, sensor histidine kinase CreC
VKIGLRVLLGYFLIVALAALLVARVFVQEVKPGVRQAMEDTLVDTANLLAELARDDLLAGRIGQGGFARGVHALGDRDIGAGIWGFDKRRANYRIYVTDARGIVVFDSDRRDLGADYSRWNDVHRTLRGQYGARSTRSDPEDDASTVMHVAAPIRDEAGRIVGVLTVAKPNQVMAPFIARSEAVVMRWGWVLMGSALLVGLVAAWWLSRQLAGLRRYADAVTAGERTVLPRVAGEFADLGRALETMRARLEGKQYVEQYVHSLTHELKSPLAAIRGAAELLEGAADSGMDPGDRARFATIIRVQSERMAAMVDKLLSLAAVEHRQQLEHPEPVDVGGVVGDATRDFAQRFRQRGVDLDPAIDRGLPSVRGDPFLLRQAIDNLIENALDFSPRGGTITVAAKSSGDEVAIEVADDGPGVPAYALPRVFERFYSLPRPDGGSRSSGLGLCFVAEVAALHGGRARIVNRERGGTRAVLTLPAA